jgi:hypothetical protein
VWRHKNIVEPAAKRHAHAQLLAGLRDDPLDEVARPRGKHEQLERAAHVRAPVALVHELVATPLGGPAAQAQSDAAHEPVRVLAVRRAHQRLGQRQGEVARHHRKPFLHIVEVERHLGFNFFLQRVNWDRRLPIQYLAYEPGWCEMHICTAM